MFLLNQEVKNNLNIEIFHLKEKNFFSFNQDLSINSFNFDTRKIQADQDFFIALKDKRDGHEFVLDAYQKGALGVIIEDSKKKEILELLKENFQREFFIIITKNNVDFLQNIARIQRDRLKAKVIAVLGSNGKTTTKDFLYLSLKYFEEKIISTPGNWNNQIGLPITILNSPLNTKLFVLELGMNHPGEIELLAKICQPDLAVITSIGREHMEFFKDLNEVAKTELEVLSELKENSYLFYPMNAPLQNYVIEQARIKNLNLILFYLSLKQSDLYEEFINSNIKKNIGFLKKQTIFWKEFQIENSNIYHLGMLSNFFLSFLVSYELFLDNLQKSEILDFINFIKNIKIISKQRFEVFPYYDTLIIDDTYNANPDSFIAAIQSLRSLFPEERLGCFAGYMAELGHYSKEGHRIVGEALKNYSIELLGICGKQDVLYILDGYQDYAVPYFETSELLANNIINQNLTFNFNNYKGILIKGSRSTKMEEITKVFRNSYV